MSDLKKLNVYIERKGEQVHVGTLSTGKTGDAEFAYSDEYLSDPDAAPVSVSLPLQKESYSSEKTKNFFDGLLPEGFTRRSVASSIRSDENDYITILKSLGCECLGAIRISGEGDVLPKPSYELLDADQIGKLAAEGASKSAELVVKAHLSLTGASGKAGLYYDGDKWYIPKGTAPSTHIVKQSHVRLMDIVANEHLCLLTAKKLGIPCPESFVINTGSADDSEVLFATRRYDRIINTESGLLDGLRVPFRLHQEDFAQAMGLPAMQKYERSGGHYLEKMFDIIRSYSSDPIDDQIKLWRITVFNYLIGNTDNHIKNHSLLYDSNLKGIRLSPAYDMLSTAVYENTSSEMGMSIGGRFLINEIGEDEFKAEADRVGMGRKTAMRHFKELADGFEKALTESARILRDEGYLRAETIKEKILLQCRVL